MASNEGRVCDVDNFCISVYYACVWTLGLNTLHNNLLLAFGLYIGPKDKMEENIMEVLLHVKELELTGGDLS